MKIITVIGARPQFIKAATVSRILLKLNDTIESPVIREIIVHTGQHFDDNMSRIFFEEMGIPAPHYNLAVRSNRHGHMTGEMLNRIEEVLLREAPDWLLVYGDTNSTLAGALAAAKINIPVAHVESGLRSFNKQMPEEINRLLTDHLSRTLFVPTKNAMENLKNEGITRGVVFSGDVMLDAFRYYRERAAAQSKVLANMGLAPKEYHLATIHRQENTENPIRLSAIFKALEEIGTIDRTVVIPLHPRTRKKFNQCDFDEFMSKKIKVIEPVGYLDMIQLETAAGIIFTDSGGVQKEAYFAGIPCVTLRDETEWVETIETGVNFLAGADKGAIIDAHAKASKVRVNPANALYGDGHAAEVIVKHLAEQI